MHTAAVNDHHIRYLTAEVEVLPTLYGGLFSCREIGCLICQENKS